LKSRFCECHDFQEDEGHPVVNAKIAEAVNDGFLFMSGFQTPNYRSEEERK
jgi:hypothetical protein